MATVSSNVSDGQALVSIIQDDPSVRQAMLAALADAGIKAQAFGSGQEFLDSRESEQSTCIVVDFRLPDMTAIDIISTLNETAGYCPPAVVVSGSVDIANAVRVMKMGCVDFIEKPFLTQEFLDKVRKACRLGQKQRDTLAKRRQLAMLARTLTDRELEILRLLLQGRSNKQLAHELDLNFKTISWHRTRALAKLGLSDMIELALHPGLDLITNSAPEAQPFKAAG